MSDLYDKYDRCLSEQNHACNNAMCDLICEIVKEERKSRPVPSSKYQLLLRMKPHIKVACLGVFSVILCKEY